MRSCPPVLGACLFFAILAPLTPSLVLAQQARPENDPVLDFLMVGDVEGWVNHLGDDEPGIDITLVPCRAFSTGLPDQYLYRWSRIYFPRTPEQLLGYDVLFFNHPRLSFFTIPQQEMMVDFVASEGKVSIAYPLSHYQDVQVPWLNSPISKAFPVDAEKFYTAKNQGLPDEFDGYGRLRLEPGRPPVFSVFEPTGIFAARIYEKSRPAYAKEGATVWLDMLDGPPNLREAPAFISWPYGASVAWAFGLHPGLRAKHWTEAGDWWELAFLNICRYTRGEETLHLDELLDIRLVKSQFSFYRGLTSMFQSIVEFVSRFGANTASAEKLLLAAEAAKADAERDYLVREFGAAKARMEEAMDIAHRAMEEASKAKDRALAWVYLSEWLVVAAVSMICAFALWGLMIRRKLYREVVTTQPRHL